jgi:hypothetical protein
MTSAAVLAGVLAFATVSQAQTGPNGNVGGNTTATDSYNDTDVDIDDSLNDNRDYDVDDSLNDNRDYDDSFNSVDTDLDVDVDDSFNDNRSYDTDLDVDVDDSFNDNSTDIDTDDSFNDNRDYDDSFNDNRDYDDSFNDNRDYDTDIDDSMNDNRDYDDSFNDNRDFSTDIDDSFNDNRDYDDSFNTDNSRTNLDLRLSLNLQELSANVSNLSFDMSEDNRGDQNARLRTGDINQNGGAFAGFAGIQTVSNNTGLASIGQAATAVSANANVTFGGSGN